MNRTCFLSLIALLAGGCTMAPRYERPATTTPASFKAEAGWAAAAPADRVERGQWWRLFGDEGLNALADQAMAANQSIALAEANYRQARYVTRAERANLLPSVDLSGGGTRTGGRATNSGGTSRMTGRSYQMTLGASWEPDLFGRIRETVNNAKATAQARAADLASARLSVAGELATNYFNLRGADVEIDLVERTIAGYTRALAIAQNQYDAGIVARTDILQAQSQLASARSELEGLKRTRATYENAIAVLVGVPASAFTLAAVQDARFTVPTVPVGVPADMLQRRPDIAAAERAVAAANASIGVQRSAFFPTISLSAEGGRQATSFSDLISAPTSLWSVGLSLAQTLFDGGARHAQVKQARAAYDGTVATYRQTVLEAFEDVENQLTANVILARQEELLRQASAASDKAEVATLNQYREGLITFTDVVTTQVSAFTARRSLLQASVDRQTAAVALIQALGGSWQAQDYPPLDKDIL